MMIPCTPLRAQGENSTFYFACEHSEKEDPLSLLPEERCIFAHKHKAGPALSKLLWFALEGELETGNYGGRRQFYVSDKLQHSTGNFRSQRIWSKILTFPGFQKYPF
jgi:hypothetical protein